MNRNTIIALVLTAVAGSSFADDITVNTTPFTSAATRAQVKAELAETIRTGDIMGSGESSLKLNELYPHRYPAVTRLAGKTRDQVKAELAEAVRTGDIVAGGASSLKLNELRPDLYPPVAKGPGKTREQVKTELAEAIRTGNVVVVGESGLKANQLHPGRYQSVTRTAATASSSATTTQ